MKMWMEDYIAALQSCTMETEGKLAAIAVTL